MPESRIETFLNQARTREKEYDWVGAIDCYTKAKSAVSSKSSFESAYVFENLGHAYYRLAMQSESHETFGARCNRAIENYDNANRYFLKANEPTQKPRTLRCKAMIAYVNYWLARDAAKKKTHVNECWKLTKKALEAFRDIDDALEYGITYNQLVDSAFLAFFLEWDFQARERIVKEAMDLGERAIELVSASGNVHEHAKALAKASVCISVFAYNFLDVKDREKQYEQVLAFWSKARELDEEAAIAEILHPFFGPNIVFGVEGTDEAITNFKRALELAKKTRDRFLIGSAFDWLTYHTAWSTRKTEGAEKQLKLSEEAAEYSRKAKEQFSKIAFTSPRADLAWIEDSSQVGSFSSIMINETDLHKMRDMLGEALRAVPKMMSRATGSGYPETMLYAHHIFSFILTALSKLEAAKEEKKRILNEALAHRDSSLRITSQIQPFMYWNRGVMHNLLATARSELAELTDEPKTKEAIIREAVTDSSASLDLKNKDLGFYKSKGSTVALIGQIAENQFFHGNLLIQLHSCTRDKADLKKAFQAYEKALAHYQELGAMSRVAECYWRIARVYDAVAEHLRSAEDFRLASISYRKAVKTVPQLKDLYEEHSAYMLSWSEIEKARDSHRKQNYRKAKEHFKKAAELHKGLKQWEYLAPNYSAWAQLEHGEELSRKDIPDEALEAFEQAAGLFKESRRSIETHLPLVELLEERTMATNVLRSTDLRYRYCLARINLEEGRLLDKKGDHTASSERYGLAAQSLEQIEAALLSEQDRREYRFLILVSRAWERMMRAEAESSSRLYLEASDYFESAKEFGLNERSRLLVLGHSQFCRALEAGMKMADTIDDAKYLAAKKHLASASNYYLKAGYQEASEYANAMELLFDAYRHIDYARKEREPGEKARRYLMVEQLLESSAGSFMKAKHFEKRRQVIAILERIREVRELASLLTSLSSLLSASRIASTRTALTVPAPTYEEAVGLEKFEHADVRANVTARQRMKVGENLDLTIELVNAGRGPALLTKIKGAIPEGFELIEKPENYPMEDSNLNLNGKRLDSLKTEEVRLVLKPKARGVFPLKPSVLYLDENGKYKASETDPLTLTVKEPIPESLQSHRNLVDTGLEGLDDLLYGGISANCAVILTSALSEERASLVRSFLETGLKKRHTTFYVTAKTGSVTAVAEEFPSSFYLFMCNPQADAMIGNRPNVFKLRGIENLTEVSIALNSALNKLTTLPDDQRRACIDIVSDILLQHHALNTRKWLNAIIPQLKSKGFTVLAVIDPEMHLSSDVHAILDLFDGEISIYGKEEGRESGRFLRILRMENQEYSGNELRLRTGHAIS